MRRLRRYPVWPQFLGVIGIFGFVGLLIASVYVPHWALALRITALVWFLGIGVFKIVLDLRVDSRFGRARRQNGRRGLR
jgi:hypothetical protein